MSSSENLEFKALDFSMDSYLDLWVLFLFDELPYDLRKVMVVCPLGH